MVLSGPNKISSISSMTNQTCHFGIMGGLAPSVGLASGVRMFRLRRAKNKQPIPTGCVAGLQYMKEHDILSKNPAGSGGIGLTKVLVDRSMGPCNCGAPTAANTVIVGGDSVDGLDGADGTGLALGTGLGLGSATTTVVVGADSVDGLDGADGTGLDLGTGLSLGSDTWKCSAQYSVQHSGCPPGAYCDAGQYTCTAMSTWDKTIIGRKLQVKVSDESTLTDIANLVPQWAGTQTASYDGYWCVAGTCVSPGGTTDVCCHNKLENNNLHIHVAQDPQTKKWSTTSTLQINGKTYTHTSAVASSAGAIRWPGDGELGWTVAGAPYLGVITMIVTGIAKAPCALRVGGVTTPYTCS